MKLCDYEIEVLRMLAGQPSDMRWGAAMGAAIESLKGAGLVSAEHENGVITYVITDAGKHYVS